MSQWQPREEQQVYGTDDSTTSISRCHQVLPKLTWSFQVYWAIIILTLIRPNVHVALMAGEIMTMTMKVTDFSWKENFLGVTIHGHTLPIIHLGDCTPD